MARAADAKTITRLSELAGRRLP
jgi:hypothetical protein